jgi:hypothetical protein
MPSHWQAAVAPAVALPAALALVWAVRSRGGLRQATVAANLASVVLVAPSCWTIGVYQYHSFVVGATPGTQSGAGQASRELPAGSRQAGPAPVAPPATPIPPPARADLPDVYYIILDAYARADSLRAFYSFDNTPFLRALERRGFYIASRSRSNYDETPLSLASSLNMEYLGESVRSVALAPNDTEPLRRMIDRNRVAAELRKLGYHYVYIGTGASQTRNETADLRLDGDAKVTGFEGEALGISALGATGQVRASQHEQHRGYIRAAFQHLEEIAKAPYPKFVLAHILAPHPPFVFAADGAAVNDDRTFSYDDGSMLLGSITRDQYREGYTAQLAYINRRTVAAVDAILRLSKRRPIIVIQGDHGSRMGMDWESQARTDLREPFSILNAYLVPAQVRRGLYPSITPVNSFRLILSRAFGKSYAPLSDRSFYSTASRPYDFSEVTKLIPPIRTATADR